MPWECPSIEGHTFILLRFILRERLERLERVL
jgi:hypothetical protein